MFDDRNGIADRESARRQIFEPDDQRFGNRRGDVRGNARRGRNL
jgi:hypothetical protein